MLSHHAVVYFVDDYSLTTTVLAELQQQYEVEIFTAPSLAISEVRRIIQSAHNRPFEKEYKVIYIATGQIAVPAQNALLKILEEPPSSTKFVLWLGRQVELLPTVQSRVQIVTAPALAAPTDVFAEFKAESIPARLARIAVVYKAKDQVSDQALYQGMTNYLAGCNEQLPPATQSDLVGLHSQLQSPGASKKMIWEAIALVLPVE